ncbi:MAG: ferrous iron transport protein A [Verrucomicrobiae bacterium]|nr:ferrous iron transport protein A [Verrucomicrobiae bacterium]
MTAPRDDYIRCPLCGFEFARADTPCARGCPLSKSCNLISCPNCCYEFPPEPPVVSWWKRLLSRHEPPKPPRDLFSLPELEEGEHAELVSLNSEKVSRRNTLAIYGLVPGSRLVLLQKRPSFIVRVGETELALETDIAREIVVRRTRCAHAVDLTASGEATSKTT